MRTVHLEDVLLRHKTSSMFTVSFGGSRVNALCGSVPAQIIALACARLLRATMGPYGVLCGWNLGNARAPCPKIDVSWAFDFRCTDQIDQSKLGDGY